MTKRAKELEEKIGKNIIVIEWLAKIIKVLRTDTQNMIDELERIERELN